MADEVQTSINIDTTQASQSLNSLRQGMDSLSTSTDKATKSEEQFNFTNEELIAMSGRYTSSLKQVEQQVQQTTVAINTGAQAATASASSFANASSTMQSNIAKSTDSILPSLSKQKIAFTDLARSVDGQGLSLRNLTSSLGALGPEGFIAAAAIAGITYAIYKLDIEQQQAVKYQKELDEVIKSASTSATSQISQIYTVEEAFKLANEGIISSNEALTLYNTTVGKSIGEVDNLEAAEKKLQANKDAYIQMIYQKAVAEAASSKAAEAQVALLSLQADQARRYQDAVRYANSEFEQGSKDYYSYLGSIVNEFTDETNKAKTTSDDFISIMKNAYTEVENFSKQNNFDPFGGKGNKQNDQLIAEEKALRESLAAIDLDAYTKEVAAFTNHVNDLLLKAKDNAAVTLKLRQDLVDGLVQIALKYEAISDERWAKAYADHLKRQDQIKVDTQKQTDELQKQLESYYISSEKIQKDITSAQSDAENDRYTKLVKEANLTITNQEQLHATLERLAKDHVANLTSIQQQGFLKGSQMISENFDKDRKEVLNNTQMSSEDKIKAIKEDQQLTNSAYDLGLLSDQDYTKETEANTKARTQVRNVELQSYESISQSFGQISQALNDLGAQNTVAAKAIGLAQIAISAGVAVAKAVAAASDLPFPANLAAIASSIAVVLTDIASAKKLLDSAAVPGGSSSGGSSSSIALGGGSLPSYTAPQIASSANTTSISGSSLNALGQVLNQNAMPLRAYVVESDITNSQQRVAGYQNQSRI